MAECEHCKREMGPEKRSDARHCNSVCRGRAYRAKKVKEMAKLMASNDTELSRIADEEEGISYRKLGMMTDEQLIALRDANRPIQPKKEEQ